MKSAAAFLMIASIFTPAASANEPVLPSAALNHFLEGVRDFAGGKLTPGPLYDPQGVGLPSGGAALGSIGVSSSLNAFNTGKPASWRAANGKLAGGSIVRSTVATTGISGQIITRQTIGRGR